MSTGSREGGLLPPHHGIGLHGPITAGPRLRLTPAVTQEQASLETSSDTRTGPHSSSGVPCLPLKCQPYSFREKAHLPLCPHRAKPGACTAFCSEHIVRTLPGWDYPPWFTGRAMEQFAQRPPTNEWEFSIWTQVDRPPPSTVSDEETHGEVEEQKERTFRRFFHKV